MRPPVWMTTIRTKHHPFPERRYDFAVVTQQWMLSGQDMARSQGNKSSPKDGYMYRSGVYSRLHKIIAEDPRRSNCYCNSKMTVVTTKLPVVTWSVPDGQTEGVVTDKEEFSTQQVLCLAILVRNERWLRNWGMLQKRGYCTTRPYWTTQHYMWHIKSHETRLVWQELGHRFSAVCWYIFIF